MFPAWIEYIVFWIDSIKLQCCEVLWRILPESKILTVKLSLRLSTFSTLITVVGKDGGLYWMWTPYLEFWHVESLLLKKEKSYLIKSVNKIKYMNFISFEKDIYM